MKMKFLVTLVTVLIITLSGCVLNQPRQKMNLDSDVVVSLDAAEQFIKDKTTKSEVRKTLGLPFGEHEKGDGWSNYTYTAKCANGTNDCILAIVFENGIYKWAQPWDKK
jgi:outer membrane protein assembly factor BamE (lipoprotein component of BamABCDE complex)